MQIEPIDPQMNNTALNSLQALAAVMDQARALIESLPADDSSFAGVLAIKLVADKAAFDLRTVFDSGRRNFGWTLPPAVASPERSCEARGGLRPPAAVR
jgi:hypothetical protein